MLAASRSLKFVHQVRCPRGTQRRQPRQRLGRGCGM